MKALVAVIAFLVFPAQAQTPTPAPTPSAGAEVPVVPIPLQVQRLAPQLVAFAGSQGNFENLVNGLALGVPVTLTTVAANGLTQTVTFTPAGGVVSSPAEIARVLESARQQLIAAGVAAPTAQQLGEAITGTTVPVIVGTVPLAPAGTPVPGTTAAGGTVPSPAQQIQSRDAAVPQVNTSDSRTAGNTSNSPVLPPAATTVPQPPAPPVTASPDAASRAPVHR